MLKHIRTPLLIASLALLGCPGAGGVGGMRPGGGGTVNPDACGQYRLNDAGRRIYAFLKATVELNAAVVDLEKTTRRACTDMATELGIPTEGDTAKLCAAVADGIRENLKVGLEASATLQVKYTPAVCTVNVDAAAQVSAECEARAQAEVAVQCQGSCSGTCNGACDGACSAENASGECAGQCQGTCRGSCSGTCEGSATVEGDASCQAAAEVRANVEATCTEPELEVTYGATIDAGKVEKVKKAIERGLPTLIIVAAKATGPVARAVATWGAAAQGLYQAGQNAVSGLGDASICVAGQIGAAFEAMASIQVSVSVSVEASASVGGACNASSN